MGNVAQPFMARGLRQENGLQMVVLDGSYQQGVRYAALTLSALQGRAILPPLVKTELPGPNL
jgi:hypothetical protein